MSEQRKYIMIRGNGVEELELKVNEKLEAGYELYGTPFMSPGSYYLYQAVRLKEIAYTGPW